MAFTGNSSSCLLPFLLGLLLLLLLPYHPFAEAIRVSTVISLPESTSGLPVFREATSFRNGDACGSNETDIIHVAMTLDVNYLRGTMAAIQSMLQHSSCPENLLFHFLSIHLDSDIVVVDDIENLWSVDMEGKVVAAPEYCHANFTVYFTDAFWSDPELAKTFDGRNPCYFNTGVMVVDVHGWRKGGYTQKVEEWMAVQKQKRIYNLGSLPPFLLVLAGNIKAVDHRWNQHGLGGDNFEGKCRTLHPGPISLLHWSGKGKPWLRLDSRKPCIVDHLWAPYDLRAKFC